MVGKTISHYKVLEKIGQGGMGEVYRAEDTNLGREVAIKVLPEQFTKDPQRLARFEREAKLLAQLNHPNIAAIHSFEHSDDVHFLVLELVPGETLQERVAKGPLPVEEALEVCRQIAEGVEATHEKGVIHPTRIFTHRTCRSEGHTTHGGYPMKRLTLVCLAKQLPKSIILSALFVLACSLNVYAQRPTTAAQIQEALEKLQESQEELVTAVKRVESNKKEIERLGIQAQVVFSRDEKDRIYVEQEKLMNETPIILKTAQKNVKDALDQYLASIQWITNLTERARALYASIEKMDVNPSNKRRVLGAISSGIGELNGGLSSVTPSKIDDIGKLIRAVRPLEESKELILDKIEDEADKVIADALIDLVIDASKSGMGEDALFNQIDGPLAKAMRVVKFARIFDGSKDATHRLVDLLDLASDIPGGDLTPVSYYIKIQKFMVERIIELIEILEVEISRRNLMVLQEILSSYGAERIQGDSKKWEGKGLRTNELFGKIPPEPSLKSDKAVYEPGDPIIVSFEGSNNWVSHSDWDRTKGWIGLIPPHVAHGSSDENDAADLEYRYMREEFGTENFTAPKTPGSYDIRMFDSDPGLFKGDGSEVASITIQVVADSGARLSLNKQNFQPDEPIEVTFVALSSFENDAWIGIIPAEIEHGKEQRNDNHDIDNSYLEGKLNGALRFDAPSTEGVYDFRMHDTDDNGKEVASVTFRVDPKTSTACPPVMQGMAAAKFWPQGCGSGLPPPESDKSLVGLWDIEAPGNPHLESLFIAINRGHLGVGWRGVDAPFPNSVPAIAKGFGAHHTSMSFSVAGDRTITAAYGQYEYCNCVAIEFNVKPTGNPDVMTGTWKYRDESGITIWRRRSPAKIHTISYHNKTADPTQRFTRHEVAYGLGPLRVERNHQVSCGYGLMRGNCHGVWITITGENFAGGHDVWIDPASHMEIISAGWLCADGFRPDYGTEWLRCGSTNTEGDGVVGLSLMLVLWDGIAPGPRTLWVDGHPIPIEMVIYGHPEEDQTP